MRKTVLFILSLLILIVPVTAQAYEDNIQYDKKKQAAIAIDYSYSAEAVENAIVKKLSQLGFKAKEEKGILNRDKGFLVYKNIYITDISKSRMDYLIKVERKKKESDESVLYMVFMKNDQNVLNSLGAYEVGNAKVFLNDMIPEIEQANLELQIKAIEESVAKAEKKLAELQKDQIELEEKLTNNIKNQDETAKDIESQRKNLEQHRLRLKKD